MHLSEVDPKSINHIITYPNSILKTVCEKVESHEYVYLDEIIIRMFELMYTHAGLGLAAPQVGISKNIFVAEVANKYRLAVINPEITCTGNTVSTVEGCLSLPGVQGKIFTRTESVHLKGLYPDGSTLEQPFDGQDAIVVQHEVDHLYGKTLFETMKHLEKRMQLKKYLKKHGTKQQLRANRLYNRV